jgi:uncharacterized protein (DUF2236 family)
VDALDPEEMLWGVVATTFDSARTVYESLVQRLEEEEREEMWAEYVRWGTLFGMPADVAPATYPEFQAAWDARIRSEWVFLTDDARLAGYETGFGIPIPTINRPGMRALELLLLGLLPERARELYGLRYGPADAVAFRAAALAVRRSRPLTPGLLRHGSCRYFFDLVAKTERDRLQSGRPSAMFEAATPAP